MQIKNVILLAGVCVVVGFGSGLLIGRQFPAHRYEKFGNTPYLLNPATGKVCNPFKDPLAKYQVSTPENPIDKAVNPPTTDPFAAYAVPASDYPPACGQ
jgi:hypothetical protein